MPSDAPSSRCSSGPAAVIRSIGPGSFSLVNGPTCRANGNPNPGRSTFAGRFPSKSPMTGLLGGLRYALRQFRHSPVFTITAILTLSLGIGGTTAIFTLIHAVMLRSLPVSDPSRLYRIGDGDDCCVEGGPQDRWGMYSFPLYERLKASAPEFEELAAFQAGGGRLSVRREGVESVARPLRSEFVTGNYFSTLGVRAFG